MSKLGAAVKSTAGELLVAALVAGMVYLSVQMFNQGEIERPAGATTAVTGSCAPDGPDAAVCPPGPGLTPTPAPATAPDPDKPFYVTVTVAE